MTAFTLKVIALVTMVLDHMGVMFPEIFGFEFRVVGRVAFPLYVFLIAEGFRHTKSPGKFLARLFAFALISEPFFDWALKGAAYPWDANFLANTNIFYTLFLGGAAIVAYKNIREKWHKVVVLPLLPLLIFAALAEVLTADYGAYGVLFIFAMYVIRHRRASLGVMAAFCIWQHLWVLENALAYGFTHVSPIVWALFPATLASVALTAFYNGRRGPGFKWFFYGAYPVHLAVLAVMLHLVYSN